MSLKKDLEWPKNYAHSNLLWKQGQIDRAFPILSYSLHTPLHYIHTSSLPQCVHHSISFTHPFSLWEELWSRAQTTKIGITAFYHPKCAHIRCSTFSRERLTHTYRLCFLYSEKRQRVKEKEWFASPFDSFWFEIKQAQISAFLPLTKVDLRLTALQYRYVTDTSLADLSVLSQVLTRICAELDFGLLWYALSNSQRSRGLKRITTIYGSCSSVYMLIWCLATVPGQVYCPYHTSINLGCTITRSTNIISLEYEIQFRFSATWGNQAKSGCKCAGNDLVAEIFHYL